MATTKKKETILNLPDVEDIPGQENVKPPRMREMEDVTISSADEEGDSIFKNDDEILNDVEDSDVSATEKNLLREAAAYNDDAEENELKDALVDRVDEDGDALNEDIDYKDLGAKDLDIPDDFEDEDGEELGKE